MPTTLPSVASQASCFYTYTSLVLRFFGLGLLQQPCPKMTHLAGRDFCLALHPCDPSCREDHAIFMKSLPPASNCYLCKDPLPPPPCDRPYTFHFAAAAPLFISSFSKRQSAKKTPNSRHTTLKHSWIPIITLLHQVQLVVRQRSSSHHPQTTFGIYKPVDHCTAESA